MLGGLAFLLAQEDVERMKTQARFLIIPMLPLLLGVQQTGCVADAAGDEEADAVFDELKAEGAVGLPEITSKSDKTAMLAAITARLRKRQAALNIPESDISDIAEHLRHYFAFLGLKAADVVGEVADVATVDDTPTGKVIGDDTEGVEDDEGMPSPVNVVTRVFDSVTQFLYCDKFTDLSCLEKRPKFTPFAKYRQEPRPDLGVPVAAGKSLDMSVFYTQAWDGKTPNAGVVGELSKALSGADVTAISTAIYGIDDIAGSMRPVFEAIRANAKNPAVTLRAVTDIAAVEKRPEGVPSWTFGYTAPANKANWLFGDAIAPLAPGGMHAMFQYSGTPDLFRLLNKDIARSQDARLRIEWPSAGIMHNKFAVVERKSGVKAVWTGTANVSQNCMGIERNANTSILIRNDAIAKAFLDQFNHMWQFDPATKSRSRVVVAPTLNPTDYLQVGRFHRNKFPIAKRLFDFQDGTRVRVHFAPTDDAEHRVILPMLLSAKPGDIIRVSMFGGTGYEIVRAFQYAVARGAEVRISFDNILAHGVTSWHRDQLLNVHSNNPYIGKVGLTSSQSVGRAVFVRISGWAGKNHYKAATLTRSTKDSKGRAVMHPEEYIVGSQNWSSGGNDKNDENLISIQSLSPSVPVVSAAGFNAEFDKRLWTSSIPAKAGD